jgi:hypothetical protein
MADGAAMATASGTPARLAIPDPPSPTERTITSGSLSVIEIVVHGQNESGGTGLFRRKERREFCAFIDNSMISRVLFADYGDHGRRDI